MAIIDGMAELQGLDKPKSVSTVLELSDHFIARFYTKYNRYDEVHLIFDDYTISNSLKTATRKKRLGQSVSVHYKIDDSSKIQHLTMKRLLSHVQTKDELTVYLANKIFDYALSAKKNIVVAYRQNVCYTTENNYEASSHEEADTKIIFHALAVSNYGVSKLGIYSPDTDVLILFLRRYPDLAKNTSFVIGAGRHQRILQLGPIFHAIGPIKIAALPGVRAFSGADVTGSFAGKGKGKCWKTFIEAEEDVMLSLTELGKSNEIDKSIYDGLEKFVVLYIVQERNNLILGRSDGCYFDKNSCMLRNFHPLNQH